MNLWTKYSLIACGAILFGACSEQHAGVISETESGKTLAGIVLTSSGKTSAHTSVYVIHNDFTAARDSVLFETVTGENGSYQILLENLPDGEYTVLFESGDSSLVAKESLAIDADTVTLNTQLEKASEIAVRIADYNLSIGDTLCVNGTLSCKIISSEDLLNGAVVLTSIPQAVYSTLSSFGNSETTIAVNVEVSGGSAYSISAQGASTAQRILSRTLPDSLQSKIQVPVDSAIVPLWISNAFETPFLMDDRGNVLPVQKTFDTGDSSLYWAVFPTIDLSASTSQKIYLFNETSSANSNGQARYALHWDSLNAEGIWAGAKAYAAGDKPDTVKAFPVIVDGKFAISFWTKIEKSAFSEDSSIALFTALEDSLGIVIRQNGSSTNLGVELFVDSDSLVISDTTIYGSSKIADGEWHHYAVSINGHHITILKDGKVIRNTDFTLSRGFGNVQNFIIGDSRLEGILDEFKILGGVQDSNSLRLIYELERPGQIPWAEVDD